METEFKTKGHKNKCMKQADMIYHDSPHDPLEPVDPLVSTLYCPLIIVTIDYLRILQMDTYSSPIEKFQGRGKFFVHLR